MNDGLPTLGELIRNPPLVIAYVFNPKGSPYQSWFPMDEHGELLRSAVLQKFLKMSRRRRLAPLMPLMAHTPKREGTPPHPATESSGAAYLFGGEGRSLNPGADLIGPLWFGKNVRVRLSARLIGPALVGDDVRISSNTSVIRSIIGPRSELDDKVNLKDSIVGADCYLGVGATLLSKEARRKNGQPIYYECWSTTAGRLLPRQLRITVPRPKMGCVIGDGCRVGGGVQLMPGTILTPGVVVPEDAGTVPAGIYTQKDLDRLLSGR